MYDLSCSRKDLGWLIKRHTLQDKIKVKINGKKYRTKGK